MPTTDLPLSHIKVLDLTRVRAGPTCVRQFADWGADVIKIENPDEGGAEAFSGNRLGPDFQNLHRNKRSMTLNLKDEDGRAVFYRMVETADVVVENYRPDVKYRLKVDYDTLKGFNRRIILGSISGFGQTGPYAGRPGFDQIAQGMGGLMSVTGLPGQGPVRAGIPVADLTAGMYCAMAILVALAERERTGEGQWVHTSLLEAQIAMMDFQAARWLMAHDLPGQAGNGHPTGPATNAFPTRDGHMNLAPGGEAMWRRMCQTLGCPELIEDARFADPKDRLKNRDALVEELSKATRAKTTQEWIDLLAEASIPCGPINNLEQTFEDPQVQHLGMAAPVDHPKLGHTFVVGQAMNFSHADFAVRSATPEFGEHTEAILADLGYSAADIADLRARKVV